MRVGRLGELIGRWTGREERTLLPLYDAIVGRARAPHWYVEGQVVDSVDGRFDMVAAILSMALLRLETEDAGAEPAARLTERFVDDMDGQLRQIGIGDIVVGKHIGKMMGMLGGRLGAYREGLAARDIDGAITRNVFRGEAPSAAALAHVRERLLALHEALRATPLDALLAGAMP